MAHGFDVLRAAIEEGRYVRLPGGGDDDWIRWDPHERRWENTDGNEAILNWRVFWNWGWEIAPAPSRRSLTFPEAVAAMDRAEIVTRAGQRFRIGGNGYVMWCEHPDGPEDGTAGWEDVAFDYDDIHATDWQIVRDVAREGAAPDEHPTVATSDERPTVAEAQAYLNRHMSHQLVLLTTRWPTLFRQED